MKRKIYTLILLMTIILKTYAQQTFSISGTVSDEQGKPLPGATVFITNTKKAIAADILGEFSFENIQRGTYEVVIKMLGFKPFIETIIIQQKNAKVFAQLKESNEMLNTVTITSKPVYDPERERQLALFMKIFFGQTTNAEKCKLLNQQVLKFNLDGDKKILKASASGFLMIENMALGYRIKYLLTEFTYEFDSRICTYGGYPYFEEMQGNADQQQEWENNRRAAYLSSERHFFRALVNNTLKEDGFLAYTIRNDSATLKNPNLFNKIQKVRNHKGGKKIFAAINITDDPSIFIDENSDFKTLIASRKIKKNDTIGLNRIYVAFSGEKESPLFYKTGDPVGLMDFIKERFLKEGLTNKQIRDRQISQIFPLADTITIYKNGSLNPLKSFSYANYWGWQRIADLTPLEYFVDPPEENKGTPPLQ